VSATKEEIPIFSIQVLMIVKKILAPLFASIFLLLLIPSASATERLCDVSFEDCRAPLLQLIQKENQEIDVAFWFMDDTNIESALIAAKNRGVFVRMLVDPRADEGHPTNMAILQCFASGSSCPTPLAVPFPMRQRVANGILHWKMMLFSGQGTVEFSGANYSASELKPFVGYCFTCLNPPSTGPINYTDEAIYFSDDANVVNSFRRKYDDWWTDFDGQTVDFADYANTSGLTLTRAYAMYPIDSEMDFLPCATTSLPCGGVSATATWQNNYGTRSQSAINAEKVKLDIDMFRITNAAIVDTTTSAFINRHLPIRMMVDSSEYRNPARVWDSYNVDRLFMAGIPIKITKHLGQNHEKALLLNGQAMTIFGSSNWTTPSFNIQQEHNYFPCSAQLAAYTSTTCFYTSPQKPWFFEWFQNQFERRWNSNTEYKAFVPLPPSSYGSSFIYKSPANGAVLASTSTTVTLTWEGGPWAQQYDVYFGTAATPPLLASNIVTGAPEDPSGTLTLETFKVSGLTPGTKYNWMIVSKTMANLSATGPIWSFTTAASTPATGATVTSITPNIGLTAGGTAVTIAGSNFVTGATVSFGFAAATNVAVSPDGTQITAKTPPHVAGTTGVTVLNKAGDSGTLPNAFTFCLTITNGTCSTAAVVPPPKLNLVSPASGSPAGGDSVIITGSNLGSGATVTFGGVPATVTNSGPVSINVTTPAGNPGLPVDVVVTRNGLSATLKGAFTYANPPGSPTVTSVSPANGSLNGGSNVMITGTGFNSGAIVTFGGPPGTGKIATTIAVVNSTTVLATTPAGAVGPADVVVTNINPATGVIDSGSLSSTPSSGSVYTYTSAPPPTVNAVSPSAGTVNGGTQITITGSNLVFGAKVFVGNQQATVQTTTGTYIYATTPAGSAAGTANVMVINPDGQPSNTLFYTYQ
jgi:hypothetical protein